MLKLEPVRFKHAYRAEADAGLALFASAPCMHLAMNGDEGVPILRTVHGVVVDGRIAFHAGDHGGKLSLLGRPVVMSVEEIIAEIPSTFIDPVMACPATTYFRSAVAHGVLQRVDDPERKARVLRALMERYQPQGGYAPIDVSDPRYAEALAPVLVAELVPERLTAKHKLGQNRKGEVITRVLEQLWERGARGDLRAIRLVQEAHPDRPLPTFMQGPAGVRFCVAPDEHDAEDVARLLEGQYWTQGLSQRELSDAQLGSDAWIVARASGTNEVVASARALADGARLAYVMDVIVRPDLRGTGLGTALMRLLLKHPRVRGVRGLRLRTKDAQTFYQELGFFTRTEPSEEMVRLGAG